MIVQESDIEFDFKPNWRVKKYDESKYFRSFSGAGYKGVDFIGITANNDLFLMEVKNYRIRFANKKPPIDERIMGQPPTIINTFIKKIEDTVKGIDAIGTYLSSKKWYRWQWYWANRTGINSWLQSDWYFWMTAAKLLDFPTQIYLLLWMELENNYENYTHQQLQQAVIDIEQRLQTRLNHISSKTIIMNTNRKTINGFSITAQLTPK